jgi:hypothetical protein
MTPDSAAGAATGDSAGPLGDVDAGSGDSTGPDGAIDAGAADEPYGGPVGMGTAARAFVKRLGRKPNFLIGAGDDFEGLQGYASLKLGVTLDLHYTYVADGLSVSVGELEIVATAGTTPMVTLYLIGGGGNTAARLADPDFMHDFWVRARQLFQSVADFDKPALVHLEPGLWGHILRTSSGDPTSVRAVVTTVNGCGDLSDDLAGLGRCLVRLGRTLSPKALIGFHVAESDGSPGAIVSFLKAIGGGEADFVVTQPADGDAGCFEAKIDPECQREGTFYWDESNTTHPNFHDHLDFVKNITDGLGKPMIWWQVPLGVPSGMPGGDRARYRDNRVHYLFGHIDEFIAAGFAGAAFGPALPFGTTLQTDGGQFKQAVAAYYSHPVPLP